MHSKTEVANLASAVHALLAWWQAPVRSMLEVGAGRGHWSSWYRKNHPQVKVVSIDISAHACAEYGHEQRDISQWRPRYPFDLVTCVGVLQYLDDTAAARAIKNLAAATRTALYLEVPTHFDMAHVVERKSTDLDVYVRSGAWYRKHLAKHFDEAGAGLWIRNGSGVMLYELEHHAKPRDRRR
ncbi:MAG: class I SAM-dependent methyltransferase [Ilumatobacteraceae bacterium]